MLKRKIATAVIFLFFIAFSSPYLGQAQEASVHIEDIFISGNKRTKEFILQREMTFWRGDDLPADKIQKILEDNRRHLVNTSLFTTVHISAEYLTPDTAFIRIEVVERWYIFPSLYFALVDRNFNEWWEEYDHDFSRTVYGGSVYWDNFTGRNDRLKLTAIGGYDQTVELGYGRPYITRRSPIGITFDIKYTQSKDIIYDTYQNKLLSLSSDEYLREFWSTSAILRYRPTIFASHFLHIRYHNNSIADTIAVLNPDFFLNSALTQQYFELSYQFLYDHRDYAAYPLHGYYFNLLLSKRGIGIYNDINMLILRTTAKKYFDLGSNFYSEHSLRGKVSFPARQPYFNQQALGYSEDLVRGYELYVIDGQHFILNRNTLKFNFLSFSINKPIISIKNFNNIPFDFYLTTHIDWGYAWDRYYDAENPLNNEMLVGAGIGIDVVTYYDTNFSVSYSINRMKEKGIYLQIGL